MFSANCSNGLGLPDHPHRVFMAFEAKVVGLKVAHAVEHC